MQIQTNARLRNETVETVGSLKLTNARNSKMNINKIQIYRPSQFSDGGMAGDKAGEAW